MVPQQTVNLPLRQSLDNLMEAVTKFNQCNAQATAIDYDQEWVSPCITHIDEEQRRVYWRPLLRDSLEREEQASFTNIEQALEMPIHPDFCEYFGRYYSADIYAQAEQGYCELLQVWNDDDFARLQENIIGHILMKRRLGQPETLFFGLTDEEDFILVVDNESGQVMLEQVGCVPTKTLAPDLATFIAGLAPTLQG